MSGRLGLKSTIWLMLSVEVDPSLLIKYILGMQVLNLCPDNFQDGKNWNFLGIFAKNREEWAVADISCVRSSVTIVPFFDSLGAGALEFVINQTEVSSMCVDQGGIDLLLKVKLKCPSIKNIITFDDTPAEKQEKAKELGVSIYHFRDVLEQGRQHPEVTFKEPTPDTIHMFCYTSGTTGDPKAAMLSHSAFVPVATVIDYYSGGLNETDVSISYLPYAHVFEQAIFVYTLFSGTAHGYYDGNPLKLLDDIKTLKPTFICTVPRILNRVH